MTLLPLRVRHLQDQSHLWVNDTGQFFRAPSSLAGRFGADRLSDRDLAFFTDSGHVLDSGNQLARAAYLHGLAGRTDAIGDLDYLILVPTLRCNLACSYCQVSRANVDQPGFDWSDQTLHAVFELLDSLPGKQIKIEFQGGEPTLRTDLLKAVIERCQRFDTRQFVVCTNLQSISDEAWRLFDNEELYISTSLDGEEAAHTRQRTGSRQGTNEFLANLALVQKRFGPNKVSALPTVDPTDPPNPDALIDSFERLGLHSIFLRPINYQGFARKRHSASREQSDDWRRYHEQFVRAIIAKNWQDRSRVLEETYTSICLRRIFQPGADRHVDLRSPNPIGRDYLVIDYDGTVYPTDESRMLTRSGVVDLSIGDVVQGWDSERRAQLDRHSTNRDDPACQRCVYQPFCGRDLIDDLARYGRIDLPRLETEFCRRHMHIFDFIFRLIYEDDPAVTYSLSRWLRLDGTPERLGVDYQ